MVTTNKNRQFKKYKVFNILYYIVWIPKYRKHIFINQIEDKLRELLFIKAQNIGIFIQAYEKN